MARDNRDPLLVKKLEEAVDKMFNDSEILESCDIDETTLANYYDVIEAARMLKDEPFPSETPIQDPEIPKWEYTDRKDPKWGTVTKKGLKIGTGPNQRIVNPDEVYRLAELGCSNREIADWFMITESALTYNYKTLMAKARVSLKKKLRDAQFNTAINGNATLLIWLGKNMLGQSDSPSEREDNQPLPWSDDE